MVECVITVGEVYTFWAGQAVVGKTPLKKDLREVTSELFGFLSQVYCSQRDSQCQMPSEQSMLGGCAPSHERRFR